MKICRRLCRAISNRTDIFYTAGLSTSVLWRLCWVRNWWKLASSDASNRSNFHVGSTPHAVALNDDRRCRQRWRVQDFQKRGRIRGLCKMIEFSRTRLARSWSRFFRKICQPTSCLHHLLPPPRDPAVTSRLRKSTLYPRPILRTKRYCSTINYALLNFQ